MISLQPRPLHENEIEGISDPHERLFAQTAKKMGFKLFDGGMITLPKRDTQKKEKRSTNPDFYIVPQGKSTGYYIEITRGENLGSRKANQKQVMLEAGLGDNYFQLTGSDIEHISGATTVQEFMATLRKRM